MSGREKEYAEKLYENLIRDVDERRAHQRAAVKPIASDIVDVLSVNLNLVRNSKAHHTAEYEQSNSQPYRLVIRRGQEFLLTLHLDREYDANKDAVLLEFDFGSRPSLENMTKRMLEVQDKDAELCWKWGAKIAESQENRLVVSVKTSGNCPIGAWSLRIHTGSRNGPSVHQTYPSFKLPGYLFILFNAWCPDDPVHLKDEMERQEYVMRDHGALWQGAKRGQYSPCAWNFGQFEDVALFAALVCLRQGSYMSDSERGDPVLISRRITAAICDNVLSGRWQDPYDDGTKPWEWTGSAAILEEYIDRPGHPVKYGQCWVFSGVLVTLCRALGLPCRSVTCVRSAHDTDKTLTIDHVYLKDEISGSFAEESSGDSVWNFHVWNEIWCERSDLPPGFDGWQAIDATPQEMSHGRYQCGPMSVEAIRRGEVTLNYDGWFIFGEVNADVVKWYYRRDPACPESRRLLNVYTDTRDVGRAVVTSQPGFPMKPLEVTKSYKAEEGTEDERVQLRHAVREGVQEERREILDLYKCSELNEDVQFSLTDLEMIKFGNPISSRLTAKNKAKSKRTINFNMELLILQYTGVIQRKVMTGSEEVTLKPGESNFDVMGKEENNYVGEGIELSTLMVHVIELQNWHSGKLKRIRSACFGYGQTFSLDAKGVDYGHLLQEHSQMCVEAVAGVSETDQVFALRDTFQIQKPTIYVEGPDYGTVNLPSTVTIYFNNPMNEVLTNCKLTVEGCGLSLSRLDIRCSKEVAGMGSFRVKHSIVPRKAGRRSLLALFNSDQLSNIRGTHEFDVIVE